MRVQAATKNASFTTTVSARIVKVMVNGNYFIVGRREIMVDDQKQIMQLSGVIRPYDIVKTIKSVLPKSLMPKLCMLMKGILIVL